MKFKMHWDTRKEYLFHILLIMGGLFVSYYIGDFLLDFQGEYSVIKMFAWFLPWFYVLDNLTEYWLGV